MTTIINDGNITILHNYPNDPTITYKEGTKRSFLYRIIEEGFYPSVTILAYTTRETRYKIPNNYAVEITWVNLAQDKL